MRDATMLAMAASSIAAETYGAQPAYPDRATLEERFRQIDLANRHWLP